MMMRCLGGDSGFQASVPADAGIGKPNVTDSVSLGRPWRVP
jgi:hypothetical protein